MKSGLEDRNNACRLIRLVTYKKGLNEVRPGRPEQLHGSRQSLSLGHVVSMKSGLEDRNNHEDGPRKETHVLRLNEVRPGRPEQ